MSNKGGRHYLVPEVIQTSNMDCGPAALKCLLEGFSIQASYGRLRDACQTDVDGTSIDTLEEVAIELGLNAEQLIIPPDHLLLDEPKSLPAIVVIEQENGITHFVVCWRKHRNWLQIMDPAVGRRWVRSQDFLSKVYRHTMTMPKGDWRDWAGTENFTQPLLVRLQSLGIELTAALDILQDFSSDAEWGGLAFLDAATRMMDSLVSSQGVQAGAPALAILLSMADQFKQSPKLARDMIPDHFWSVSTPSLSTYVGESENPVDLLNITGAVIVHVKSATPVEERTEPQSDILQLALKEAPLKPFKLLMNMAKECGKYVPVVLVMAMAVAALGVLIEGLLFFSLIDVHRNLNQGTQKLVFLLLVLTLTALLLAFQFPTARLLARLGRQLEIRIRLLLLKKLPRIGDQYFSSRLQSDMAERSHMLYFIRDLPVVIEKFIVGTMGLLATTCGLIFLLPALAPWLLVLVSLIVLLPLLIQQVVSELDLHVRSHVGALSHFYLDSLMGIAPIRAHSAEGSIRNGHESRLTRWAETKDRFLRLQVLVQAVQLSAGAALIWILINISVTSIGQDPSILLIVYWLLSLPVYGSMLSQALLQYPAFRNITLRIMDPIQAPESHIKPVIDDDKKYDSATNSTASTDGKTDPIAIEFRNVSAKAGGHYVLENVNLNIQPGEHVAIVGESGAGKSSLVGMLFGWLEAEKGKILIDGLDLDNSVQSRLWRKIAWVDPSIQIWNESLGSNLRYGTDNKIPMSRLISQADLLTVLSSLKDGVATRLGESGSMISGGEGQRVRIGRALARPNAGCVILDEPFRGLDRTHRRRFQGKLREVWQQATLLYITHDIGDTSNFSRIIVMSQGQCIEDGSPEQLLADSQSSYYKLYHDDRKLQTECWSSAQWSNWRMNNGVFTDLTENKPGRGS